MESKIVEKLEEKIEEAIAAIMVKMGLKKLPLLTSHHTMHLMAKAAVTVYVLHARHPGTSSDRGRRAKHVEDLGDVQCVHHRDAYRRGSGLDETLKERGCVVERLLTAARSPHRLWGNEGHRRPPRCNHLD